MSLWSLRQRHIYQHSHHQGTYLATSNESIYNYLNFSFQKLGLYEAKIKQVDAFDLRELDRVRQAKDLVVCHFGMNFDFSSQPKRSLCIMKFLNKPFSSIRHEKFIAPSTLINHDRVMVSATNVHPCHTLLLWIVSIHSEPISTRPTY